MYKFVILFITFSTIRLARLPLLLLSEGKLLKADSNCFEPVRLTSNVYNSANHQSFGTAPRVNWAALCLNKHYLTGLMKAHFFVAFQNDFHQNLSRKIRMYIFNIIKAFEQANNIALQSMYWQSVGEYQSSKLT